MRSGVNNQPIWGQNNRKNRCELRLSSSLNIEEPSRKKEMDWVHPPVTVDTQSNTNLHKLHCYRVAALPKRWINKIRLKNLGIFQTYVTHIKRNGCNQSSKMSIDQLGPPVLCCILGTCTTSYPGTYGCFQKSWYPQIINFNGVFHCKPSILGVFPLFLVQHPYTHSVNG